MALNSVRSLTLSLRSVSLGTNFFATQVSQKIKRPRNAYAHFIADNSQRIRRNNPNLKQMEVMSIAAKEWNTLSEYQKGAYKQKAEQEVKEYKTTMSNLTDEQKDDMMKEKHKAKQTKRIRKLKKEISELVHDKPDGRPNTFLLYRRDKWSAVEGSITDKVKKLGKSWKTISMAEKKKYEDQAAVAKKHWDEQMNLWNLKISKDGRKEQLEALTAELKALKKDM